LKKLFRAPLVTNLLLAIIVVELWLLIAKGGTTKRPANLT